MYAPALRSMLDFEPLESLFKKAASYINIASLFKVAGREGAYYGDSYDEILRKNNEALGPELIVNGDFSNGTTGWLTGNSGTLTESGGRATLTNGAASNGYAYQTIATVPNSTYVILAMCAGGTAPAARVFAGVSLFNATLGLVTQVSPGVYMLVFTATTATTWVSIATNSTTIGHTFVVDNFSVKQLVDYSKLVLFDDPNGTVPVFHPLQTTRGKGLLLDRSKGLVRGPELITNGNADTNIAGWTQQAATISWNAGTIAVTTIAGAGGAWQDIVTTAGKWYCVVADSISAIDSSIQIWVGGGFVTQITPGQQSVGTRRMVLYFQAAGASTRIYLRLAGTGAGAFDNVTVKEVLGNHMSQPTAAARGELSARINLLLSSNDYSVAPWTNSAGVTFAAGVATFTTTGYRYQAYNHGAPIVNLSFTYRAVVSSPSGKQTICMRMNNSGVGADDVRQLVVLTASPQVVTLTRTFTGAGNTIDVGFDNRATIGDGIAGSIIVHSADLRLTTDAIPSLPSHQTVRSATDYDTTGFPVYWRAQTDDWAKARINPNGATKALVMWAGQKMSDAAAAIVLEHGLTSLNNGTLYLAAPQSNAANNIGAASRGTLPSIVALTGHAAPKRVMTGLLSSITEDICQIIVNNVTATSNSEQGTGAYLDQDTYFGSRAGTSLFMNIREFAPPLIIFMQTADPGLSVAQLKRLQRKYAKAVGVTL